MCMRVRDLMSVGELEPFERLLFSFELAFASFDALGHVELGPRLCGLSE